MKIFIIMPFLAALLCLASCGGPQVILLTGFEPFAGQPQNGSWEAVKALDGREMNGFVIRARQIRVVWGEPMKQLDAAIKELHPVAVFSFGEAGPDGFRIESRARNLRGNHKDNDGRLPPRDRIVPDGPDEYEALYPIRTLYKALYLRGYPVSVSNDAGQYLCEECFYSLRHLQMASDSFLVVQFLHVPPLGVQVPGREKPVDAEYLSGFAQAVVESWSIAKSR
jgi:pyroglutamyl-peptidase